MNDKNKDSIHGNSRLAEQRNHDSDDSQVYRFDDQKFFSEIGRFVFHNSPLGFFRTEVEPTGRFLEVNRALADMFGYEHTEQIYRKPVRDMYWNPADRLKLINALQSGELVNGVEYKFKKLNGDGFWGAVFAKKTVCPTTDKEYLDGCIQDISRRKEYELRIVQEKNFSDGIIEAMPGLFCLFDEDGNCVRWNKNVEAIYGYTPEELKNLHALKDLVTPETLEPLLEAADRALKGGSGYCEYEIVTKYGQKISFAGDSNAVMINGKKYLASMELDITNRKQVEEKLKKALSEIKHLKEQLETDNIYLMDEIREDSDFENIVGESPAFKKVLTAAKRVAPTNTTVLIQGETGTGKGVLAQLIHNLSLRNKRPLVKINCANLPTTLIESILYGHEKGAFTNANTRKIGRFEIADGSTLFLDEIAELPLDLQPKLLRVIEEGEFERLGGNRTIRVDVRIVAATNRDLATEVKEGRFRQDLLFRLNVYPLISPALRQRPSDIPLLVKFYLNKLSKTHGKSITKIPINTIEALVNYHWPGNIRELQNVIERAIINSPEDTLVAKEFTPEHAPSSASSNSRKTLREVESEHIIKSLEEVNWVIEGNHGAAKILGLHPSTLRSRMRKLGIRRPAPMLQS